MKRIEPDLPDDSPVNPDIPQELPDNFIKSFPSALEKKKIKKPLLCYLLDIDPVNRTRATLVMKPIKVKYGAKWFDVGREQRYFINYQQIMNFGKHYAYLCQYGNSTGALSFYEYKEFVDSNQVYMMANQHAVEVFKKHKGIDPKILLIIAIVAGIAVISTVILANVALGQNNTIVSKQKQIETLTAQNTALKAENDALKGVVPSG